MKIFMEHALRSPGTTCKNARALNFRCMWQLLYFARCMYVIIAAVVVCHGFHNAFQKMMAEDVSTRQENQAVDKMRYPSITFCYKYKHGLKRVFDNLLPRFYEEAKNKGTFFELMNLRKMIKCKIK